MAAGTLLKEKPRTVGDPPTVPYKVCFVCTGNTCRSPMAAAVANAMACKEKKALQAFSAGLYATEGEAISPNAQAALAGIGIKETEISHHRAHTLTKEEAEGYDRIIAMTGNHMMELLFRFPSLASRITCMPKEIVDPFGYDLSVYQLCLAEITEGIKVLLFEGDAQ